MPAFGEQFRPFYPGLIPVEAELWRAWCKDHESEFDAFEYNVHVGEGVNIAPRTLDGDPELQRRIQEQFRQATQKKIDAVGYQRGETWIFEVEERPGTRALGQLLTYETLLPRTKPDTGPITLAIVARRLGTDMLGVFESHGIVVYLVELPPFAGTVRR